MPRPLGEDPEILRAALIGWQHMLDQVNQRIAELTSQTGTAPPLRLSVDGARPKRVLSAAARRRIALAQKKRWAAYNAEKARKAKPKPEKRAAGAVDRTRVAAGGKRAPESRKAQAKASRKVPPKSAVRQAPAEVAPPAPPQAAAATASE